MQSIISSVAQGGAPLPLAHSDAANPLAASAAQYAQYKVIRRNGAVVPFEPSKATIAMTKAFLAVSGGQGAASARIREVVAALTGNVVNALMRRQPAGGTFHIEDVQDQVELSLMRSGEHEVARAYVLYRERRAGERAKAKERTPAAAVEPGMMMTGDDGRRILLDAARLQALLDAACAGLPETDGSLILASALKNLYDGVPAAEVRKSLVLSARTLIESDPAYGYATARLLLHDIRLEVLGREVSQAEMEHAYADYFPAKLRLKHARC